MEIERSRYSDHELRALDEAQRLAKRKADLDDEDEQNILLVQDLEEMWEQKFLQFKPGARITGVWAFQEKRERGVEGKYSGFQSRDSCLTLLRVLSNK